MSIFEGMTQANYDDFLDAYVETALWLGEDGEDWRGEDLPTETMDRMRADCYHFLKKAAPVISEAIETGKVKCGPDFDAWGRAGHDFWLTRNGHGAGFWDGDWPEPQASQLYKLAKHAGECALYRGDDGFIYPM